MAGFCNHRAVAITTALIESSRMNMHISNDFHLQLAALFPNQSELSAIKLNYAVYEAVWVNIVVIEKLLYFAHPALSEAEKKGATLVHSVGP
jgi:hypothetical protein